MNMFMCKGDASTQLNGYSGGILTTNILVYKRRVQFWIILNLISLLYLIGLSLLFLVFTYFYIVYNIPIFIIIFQCLFNPHSFQKN